jgi:uncharacterized protein
MLSNDQLDRLQTLLDDSKRRSIEAIDGVFCAALVGPGDVKFSNIFAAIEFEDSESWANEAVAQEALGLLFTLWNDIAARIAATEDDDQGASLPYVGFPDDDDPDLDATDIEVAGEWAEGFVRGMAADMDGWEAWIDDDPAIGEAIEAIVKLAQHNSGMTLRSRLEEFYQIPYDIADFNARRLHELHPGTIVNKGPKTGRNDPCTCGSGKKFKKCCGNDVS